MSEKKGKKFPIKIKTLSKKPQGETKSQPCEPEITAQNSKLEEEEINQGCEPEISKKNGKIRTTVITTEISTRPKIVGQIPPWDDDEESPQDDKPKPPTITAEIPCESEKIDLTPRATGEIPPWDDEEESN
jgi:hypothetical protein